MHAGLPLMSTARPEAWSDNRPPVPAIRVCRMPLMTTEPHDVTISRVLAARGATIPASGAALPGRGLGTGTGPRQRFPARGCARFDLTARVTSFGCMPPCATRAL